MVEEVSVALVLERAAALRQALREPMIKLGSRPSTARAPLPVSPVAPAPPGHGGGGPRAQSTRARSLLSVGGTDISLSGLQPGGHADLAWLAG